MIMINWNIDLKEELEQVQESNPMETGNEGKNVIWFVDQKGKLRMSDKHLNDININLKSKGGAFYPTVEKGPSKLKCIIVAPTMLPSENKDDKLIKT
jgi:hypothetical protein